MKRRGLVLILSALLLTMSIGMTPVSAKSSTSKNVAKAKVTAVKKKTTTKKTTTKKKVTKKSNADKKRDAIVSYAKRFLGNRYVYGGTSLTRGTDCSGFTMSVYKKFGYKLPRCSREQARKGKKVSTKQLKKGDLLFYSYGGRIGHVAMYIGGGKIIHASCPREGIKISKYNYHRPTVVKRFIK